MINILKKYWKLIFFAFCLIILISISLFNDSKIEIESDKKLSEVTIDEEIKKDNKNNILYVDIKGAVLNPGVYQMEKDKRVIDVINLAGGLKEDANTVNLNLSKKLYDEMYIIVYTNFELESYLKNNDGNDISCVSLECICPNPENEACITENSNEKNSTIKNEITGKISINNASKDELMKLNGIGTAKAESIIKYRKENGLFNNIEDIKNVSGISDKIFEKIKNDITL